MMDLIQRSARSTACVAVMVTAGAFALTACGEKASNTTVGEKVDSAIASTKQAASEAKEKTESSTANAESSIKEGAAEAKASAKDAGASVAATVDDASITAEVSAGLAKDPDLSAIKINVDTKGGTVSLMGPAPTAAAKARAEEIAKNVKGVSSVDNQLEVKSM